MNASGCSRPSFPCKSCAYIALNSPCSRLSLSLFIYIYYIYRFIYIYILLCVYIYIYMRPADRPGGRAAGGRAAGGMQSWLSLHIIVLAMVLKHLFSAPHAAPPPLPLGLPRKFLRAHWELSDSLCLLPIAYCPLAFLPHCSIAILPHCRFAALRYCRIACCPIVYRILLIGPLPCCPIAYCRVALLPYAYGPLAHWPIAYCLVPVAYSLLPTECMYE